MSYHDLAHNITCNEKDTVMATRIAPSSNRERVRDHRTRLRAQGLRPIQIWVPDVRSDVFAAEARRQSAAVAAAPGAAEDQAFIDSISVWAED